MVEALTETSSNLAKEINDESKQQNIDVQQGTDDQNVDSKDENLLYINDDKKTKNISKTTKAIWGWYSSQCCRTFSACCYCC